MDTLISGRKSHLLKTAVVLGTFAAFQIAGADLAFAASGDASGAFAPLQTAVQLIVDFINGPFGRLVAIIAVISSGFLAFAGRLSWMTAGSIILGIGLVFGAPTIVDQMISSVGS